MQPGRRVDDFLYNNLHEKENPRLIYPDNMHFIDIQNSTFSLKLKLHAHLHRETNSIKVFQFSNQKELITHLYDTVTRSSSCHLMKRLKNRAG